ncbi:DegT/DnrJ/EryC1/StrS family aminotransferase [Kiritimatiella glycovorans]|uniref:Putative aminotransferase n=1 Tax=Kiritimatiella glycovorans TaxID=1307763 RepID=A0A0G3ECS7_9BACT|nr:DegT/DnrJ/EryC1/StrS family aminotransferase [Kiritimatiella glycovorans]AKJ64113.1 putative aminotransferase [Kiritimatiella glycovorans]
MNVPLLDLRRQYETLRDEIEPAVREIFETQRFVGGPAVEACERAMAEYCGAAFGCGVSSGTDALLVSLMAEDIGEGDEVLTTPFTFFATAGSIIRSGARPVFADIDPVTYNLDPEAAAAAVTSSTRALMPVHLFGQPAAMDPLGRLAEERGLAMIEDACQAVGAEYRGRRAGSFGDYGCFSFFPSKNLGGAGDGGMIVTGDEARVKRLKSLRNHGMEERYHHHTIGGNFRLDALQAAVVTIKLRYLEAWSEARRANAERYARLFAGTACFRSGAVRLPETAPERRHIFNQYVIRAERRDALMARLRESDVGCAVYYPVPLHLQPCFRSLGYARGDFPVSEKAAAEVLALPIFPELTDDEASRVVEAVEAFYRDDA